MSCVRRKGRAAHQFAGISLEEKSDLNICAHLCGNKQREQKRKMEKHFGL